jgi:hypothetical protein
VLFCSAKYKFGDASRIVLVSKFSLVLEGFTVFVSIPSEGHNSVQFLENMPV